MRAFLLLFICLLAPFAASLTPVEQSAHKATIEISQYVIYGNARCSATVIGPHAILTASHCELPTDTLFIAGNKNPISILGRIRDGQDHSIYLVEGVTFKDFATVDLYATLEQGEEVFMFGNPGEWHDILRRGYVTGREHRFTVSQVLFSFGVDHGDSGSGVFNSKGNLIGVLSRQEADGDSLETAGIDMGSTFPLTFTSDDLARAKTF